MDAHHDIVMRAREAASGPSRLYFAWSTILDRDAFLEWRDQHSYDFFDLPQGRIGEALDVGLVYDFPSRWWGGRVAGMQDRAGSVVYGVVFEIAAKDWPIVQHKEGFITRMAVEKPVRVKIGSDVVEATAFVTNPERASTVGPISARFVDAISRGAESAGLPESWVKELRSAQ